MRDGWSPEAYRRFTEAREAPFDQLLSLLTPAPGGALVDLGCGDGRLTVRAHQHLGVAQSLGLDSSAAMLAGAPVHDGVRFELRDIATALPEARFDVVLSNAALHWVPEHRAYLDRLLALVAPGGQLAFQVPYNPRTPLTDCAREVAAEFAAELHSFSAESPVEPPERYAEWLALSPAVKSSRVGTWLFPQLHASSDGLADFALGGHLTPYRARLNDVDFARFVAAYRAALRASYGNGPVFFAFQRLFVWARL